MCSGGGGGIVLRYSSTSCSLFFGFPVSFESKPTPTPGPRVAGVLIHCVFRVRICSRIFSSSFRRDITSQNRKMLPCLQYCVTFVATVSGWRLSPTLSSMSRKSICLGFNLTARQLPIRVIRIMKIKSLSKVCASHSQDVS